MCAVSISWHWHFLVPFQQVKDCWALSPSTAAAAEGAQHGSNGPHGYFEMVHTPDPDGGPTVESVVFRDSQAQLAGGTATMTGL